MLQKKAKTKIKDTKSKAFFKKMAALSLGTLLTAVPSAASAASAPAQTFSDVDAGYWAYQDIENLAAKGIVSGYAGLFHPEDNVTRAEFAKMIVGAQGLNYVVYQNTNGLRVFQTQADAIQYARLWDHSFVVATSTGNIVWNNFDSSASSQLQADASHPYFSDVDSSFWGFRYIEAARIAKVIAGKSDGTFGPAELITREDIAAMVMRSIGVAGIQNYSGSPLTYSDKDQVQPYALTATTIANNLGIVKGESSDTLAPLSQAKRSEAVAMVSRLLNLTPAQIKPLQQQAVVKIDVSPTTSTVASGKSVSFSATCYNADGVVMPVIATWSTTGGVGSISTSGVFTGKTAGTGSVLAQVPGATGVTGTASVKVTAPTNSTSTDSTMTPSIATATTTTGLPNHLSFEQATTSLVAGESASLHVDVRDKNNAVIVNDSGRKITLTVTDPENRVTTYTATDQNGVATFLFPEKMAGSYDLSAADSNHLSTSSDGTLKVIGAAPVGIALDVAPSPFLVKGQTANVRVYLQDEYGNQTTGPDTPVTLSVSSSSYGTLTQTGNTVTQGSSVLGAYQAGMTPGDAVITATPVNSSYAPVTLTVTTMSNSAQVVSGKGMWLMHGYDWHQHPDDYFIQQAKANGITHLYIELGATGEGFWGQDVIDGFITKAHQAHIAVIDWVYASLNNPASDARMTVDSATYTAPGGDRADGIAADLEENVTANTVTQYAQAVRAGVGSSYKYPLIAVTYPPSSRPNYPWSTFGKYFDVMEPMDYWHYMDEPYTANQAYAYVKQSIQQIQTDTGNAGIPITIAGQSYNMFNDNQSPTAAEEQAAMQAAQDYGAIGYSMYRWGTATTQEWNAFNQFPW